MENQNTQMLYRCDQITTRLLPKVQPRPTNLEIHEMSENCDKTLTKSASVKSTLRSVRTNRSCSKSKYGSSVNV